MEQQVCGGGREGSVWGGGMSWSSRLGGEGKQLGGIGERGN